MGRLMSNRMVVMWVALVVLISFLFFGEFGTVEVTLWLAALVAWLVVTLTWARHGARRT